jgi:hypothetical protein
LDVINTQFGAIFPSDFLTKMMADLRELEAATGGGV